MLHEFLNSTNENDIITQKLYGIQKLDCDKFLPKETINIMNSSTLTDQNLEVPEIYLHKCLLNSYDADINPYKLVPKSVAMYMNYTFAINELLTIENEGTISMTARVFLRWFDPRFRWTIESSIIPWKWPTSIEMLAHKIWIPKLSVQNCQKQNCPIQIYNRTIAYIADKGRVWIAYSDLVQASCDIKLKNFPFDTQHCEVKIAFNNLGNNSYINQSRTFYVDYMVDNDEWMVTNIELSEFTMTAYTFHKDSKSPDKWHRKLKPTIIRNIPAFRVVVSAKRESGYFVTNLIVPILLVLCISIASLFIPPNLEDRYNIQLAVILSFVFFQSVLAAVMPQTRGSPRLCRYVMYSMLVSTVEIIISFVLRGLDNLHVSPNSKTYEILDNYLIKIPDSRCGKLRSSVRKFVSRISLKRQELDNRTQNSQVDITLNSNPSSTLMLTPLENLTGKGTQTDLCHSCSQMQTTPEESADKEWHAIIQRFNIITGILVLIFYIFVFCRYMGPLLYHFFKGLNETKFYYDRN